MRIGLLAVAVCTAAALTACSSGSSPSVPNLGGAGQTASPSAGCLTVAQGLSHLADQGNADPNGEKPDKGAPPSGQPQGGTDSGGDPGNHRTCAGKTGDARKNALHAAADCIRQHGIPTYKDPVLTADGHVYTDSRSMHEAQASTIAAVAQACHDAIVAAELVPDQQAPAPPKVVQAGVKVAQCMRANGLPNISDPNANDEFVPGHGFGMDSSELPGNGSKTDPTIKHALVACESVIDEMNRVSSLGSLAG
ncbi:hypothetical protein GCM10022255_008130 [Dactylosporangium darangshiense]|uniref:Secreted protein n=1 Tax=Dactylosporangium darangshiense TaxID=579108 RepID=A0ABP8CXF1_9ACTN